MVTSRIAPVNADYQRCQWYDSERHSTIEVHLWGDWQRVVDSVLGHYWRVRHCAVCGVADIPRQGAL